MRMGGLWSGLFLAAVWVGALTGTAVAEDGKAIFDAKKCINCHSIGAQKGPMAKIGGSLDGVGSKRDAAWLKGFLTDPKSKMPEGKMSNPKLNEQEIDSLAQYLLTIK